ncbi:hypothetical protein C8R43DRAFT_1174902 [Mycena crocata]|nr:hypothetical protein C8R43DRAFT_1174902 [Mycena crocata]
MLLLLPKELFGEIFAELDEESLGACALVCSSLLSASQRLIFRSVTIRYADIPRAVSLFTASPHLSAYVRDVQLEFEVHLSAHNSSLATILPTFYALERLTIRGGIITWASLSRPLHSAIWQLFASASFHSLNVSHLHDIPAYFIRAMSSVRNLGIYNISLDLNEESAQTVQLHNRPFTPSTQRLILRTTIPNDVCPVLDLVLSEHRELGCLNNLQDLTVGINREIRSESLRLITATASVLRHLRLRCGAFHVPLELPYLPALRTLEIKVYLGYVGQIPLNLYAALAALPKTTPAIEVVELVFYRLDRSAWVYDSSLGLFAGNHDSSTDLFAGYRDTLPSLRRVRCHLNLDSPSVPYADFFSYVEQMFPSLQGTGILVFSHRLGEENDPLFPWPGV